MTAGRHGGDEFLLLVDDLPREPQAAARELTEIGSQILSALREPFTVARSSFEINASAGGSIFPVDAENHAELVDHADQAMYVAKRNGGARMVLFDEPESHSVLELEATLRARRALANGELELFYQPVVEIADGGGLGGLEALIRWRDPDRGLLLPEAFLPFIEHSPLVEEIGEWVFTEICRQLARWRERGFAPRVSFNIPARQLERPGFAEFVIRTAAENGADLPCLAAEITETSPVALEDVLPTLTSAPRGGIRALARRLRHRLQLACSPARDAVHAAQDRPQLHGRDPRRPGGRGAARGDHLAREDARDDGDRRRGRDGRAGA